MLFRLLPIGAVLSLGFALRVFRLARNGFGNEYYSAAVFSMTRSLHNFAYSAFDPAGLLAVDKPPLALWVQAVSARLFGFRPLSVLLPQAVEGTLTILVVWHLVRRSFGERAGLLAALVLALTPISVAVDRSSNVDSCLVLVLVLAAWALLVATERGSLRGLVAAMALVGVAFNVKMMAAFVVLPAFALVWWLGAPVPARRRVAALAAGGAACLAVSLAWVGAVELTPPAERPYVDSSPVNSMLDLVVDHNALQRFIPRAWQRAPGATARAYSAVVDRAVPAGPLRLADPRLASQVSWLAPLALIGTVAALTEVPLALPLAPATLALVLWLGWAFAYVAVYSLAGGLFSPYYLVTLAPAFAAMSAIGLGALWSRWRAGGAAAWLLPAALLVTAAWQVGLILPSIGDADLMDFDGGTDGVRIWLVTVLLAGTVVAAVGLVIATSPRVGRAAAIAGLLAVATAPAVWATATAVAHTQGGRPVAALDNSEPSGPRRGSRVPMRDMQRLAAFLKENRGGRRFLAATSNAREAAPLIIAARGPVIAIGGFMGSIPVVPVSTLNAMVASGQLRFVLLDEPNPRATARRRSAFQEEVATWVRARGVPIDPARWRGNGAPSAQRAPALDLYDMRPEPVAGGLSGQSG